MFTLSVCMIVKDEEDCLARILSCAQKFADEIIVVDTGSTDNSKQIAKKFTDKVFDFAWCDDFAKARNFSFSLATCDYQMWLDADDFIDEQSIQKILALKKKYASCSIKETEDFQKKITKSSDKQAGTTSTASKQTNTKKVQNLPAQTATPDVFMCKYAIGFDKQNHPALVYDRERIVKRSQNFLWQGFVHEVIVPSGKIEFTDIQIQHRKMHEGNPKRNLLLYEQAIKKGVVFNPREQYYFSRELFYNSQYKKAAQNFAKFIKIPNTFPPDRLGAHLMLSDCHKALGQTDKAVQVLLSYIQSNAPNAEVCCKLAYLFQQLQLQNNAVFWFKAALSCPKQTIGFVNEDFQEFIPCIELSRLLFFTDFAEAKQFHKKAKAIRPAHPAIVFNEKFFDKQ